MKVIFSIIGYLHNCPVLGGAADSYDWPLYDLL